MLFKDYYERLAIYRKDIIIPFGFLSMLIQALVFAWFTSTLSRSATGSRCHVDSGTLHSAL
jgi:hypothetical protein